MFDRAEIGDETPVLAMVAESLAGEIGEEFLLKLVAVLGGSMRASLVLLAIGEGRPPKRVRAIFALQDGARLEDLSYDLDRVPCTSVYTGEEVVIPCDLAKQFPKEAGLQSYIGMPLRDADNRVLGHLAVFSDQTLFARRTATDILRIFALRAEAEIRRALLEREREMLIADLVDLNARLRRQFDALREESAFKSQLLGLIAHDLRNPLAAIIGQSELAAARLARAAPDLSGIAKAVDRVSTQAGRMADMIATTLERVRSDERRLAAHRRPVDLRRPARMAVELSLAEAERKRIELVLADGPPVEASVDEELILRAIDNLVGNAVKYTPPGGRVAVALRKDADQAEIAVTDTGQGLSGDDLARAFGRFATLSAKPTGGESSVGLGLANVRDIAAAHGGTCDAASDGPGLGAVFRIRLPAA